jgi:rhamnulokinase
VIHIVGGGSQNRAAVSVRGRLLQSPGRAGPVEATAIGNVLVQAVGLKLLGSLAEGPRSCGGRSTS